MLFTGVRTMVEGQGVLEYFGANGYRLILFFTFNVLSFNNAVGMISI